MLDCGTGSRALGQQLAEEPGRRLELVFSHLHMDHLFGLPFFAPVHVPEFEVHITVPAQSGAEARDKVARYLDGLYHPVRLDELQAAVSFQGIRPPGPVDRGGWTLRGASLSHPGGSLGYRVEVEDAAFCYVTDTAPFARPGEGLGAGRVATAAEKRILRLLEGADVVVYDTMFTRSEYLKRMTWGHSYPEYAVALAEAAGVGRLVLFHHAPGATDEALDALQAHWAEHPGPTRVTVAREGEAIEVGEDRAAVRRRDAVNAEG